MDGWVLRLGCSILLISAVGCASEEGPRTAEQVATPAVGSPQGERAEPSSRGKAGSRKSPGSKPKDNRSAGRRATPSSGDTPASTRKTPGDGPATAIRTASRTDPSGDPERSGHPPAYADIRSATLRGTSRTLKLILRVDGEIPNALPQGADMTLNFRLDMKGKEEHQVYAVGGRDGWRADLDNSGSFPGRFAIADNSFVFELPWSRLGGPARFRWEAETAWTYTPSGPLAETEFSFDRVPEYEAARFPE